MGDGAAALETSATAPAIRPSVATGVLRPAERFTLLALGAAMLGLRLPYAFAYPFDSDEPQHLHVAWAWTRGLLQYRDVFDNHAPLFHMLSAPLVGLFGETPRILVLMRLAMIPLFALTLWGSFLLGRSLFGARVGLWSAVICGLSPTFFFKGLEYRADVLWAALWVLAIAVLCGGEVRPRRTFCGGLLIGACLAVSLKTTMLLLALAIASAGVLALAPRPARDPRRPHASPARDRAACAASALGGIAVLPLAIVLYFAARGALPDLVRDAVLHNTVPGVGIWGKSSRHLLTLPILALLLVAARAILRRFPGQGARAAFLFLLAGSQYVLLSTLWPVHTRQDLLPFYPLLTVLLAGLLLARREAAGEQGGGGSGWSWTAPRAAILPLALAVLELLVLPALSPITARGTAAEERLIAEVLALTGPDDYVLDLKGQAVFRNRPYYYALEKMTLERMARGLIEDTIPERCVATRTCVAQASLGGFPPRARRFLEENYVVVGAWRVAGRMLERGTGAGPFEFDLAIEARYAIVDARGPAGGILDGRPYDGPRELLPGRHAFVPEEGTGPFAVVWSQAIERGFSPFVREGEVP